MSTTVSTTRSTSIDQASTLKKLQDSDITCHYAPISQTDLLEGLAKLAVTGTVEMTQVVEEIHCELMLRPLGKFKQEHINNWKSSLSGKAYTAIKHIVMTIGNNLTSAVRLYNHVESSNLSTESLTLAETLKLLVNAVNGVMGDHLVNQDNPLATPMAFYDNNGKYFSTHRYNEDDKLSGRVIIFTHGLCMSHLSWRAGEEEGYGEQIMRTHKETTVLYLDYNTGRHISQNGREFANRLEQLMDNNPDITQIDLVGHSMGGLVSRSALFYGEDQQHKWFDKVGNLITLGSPHHGAVLERIGYYVLDVVSKIPFAGTLAKMGDIRSAGIIDLRHGSIRDDDWQHLEKRTGSPDDIRVSTPLPKHIKTYLVAGTLESGLLTAKANNLVGDSLVTIESALGEHAGDYAFKVPEGHKAIFYGVGHMALQYNDRVCEQLLYWLSLDENKNVAADKGKNSAPYIVPSQRIESYPTEFDIAV